MANLLLVNGPNLNMLGHRETNLYGGTTLSELTGQLINYANQSGHELSHFQSNAEHDLIDRIQQAASEPIDYIIINPAGYTHSSVALRDALLAVSIPFIEVHITNLFARESFRHHSYLADIAAGVITGFGTHSYFLALDAINPLMESK